MPDVTDGSAEPYCSQCGYVLAGLTDSSKCPECGGALVDVLMRPGDPMVRGKRYRSERIVFGLPLVDVAFGPAPGEPRGRARGFIAIGDEARGVIALGGAAFGGVTIGGFSVGVFSVGGASIGLLSALGGFAAGLGLSVGGGGIGGMAAGGFAAGVMAQGGMACGYFARGGAAFGVHAVDAVRADPAAVSAFDRFAWVFGGWPPAGLDLVLPILVNVIVLGIAAVGFAILGRALSRRGHPDEEFLR